jgi:hypothetical protein
MGLASVFGKTVEAIEDFRGWFADRFAKVGAIDRPAAANQRHVMDRDNEWMHREIALGHTVTSELHPESQAAIAKINHEAAMERQALYRSDAPTLKADRRKRCDRIGGLYTQLVDEVSELRDLERLHRQFAAACGVEMPPPTAPSADALSEAALLAWRARAEAHSESTGATATAGTCD